MKKIIKSAICITLAIALICVFSIVLFREYASRAKSIRYLGNQYTNISDNYDYDFIPFGDYNSFYQENNEFITIFGISFEKRDINRNFVYVKFLLDNIVYVKDSYKIPNNPSSEEINEIVIFVDGVKKINITDKYDVIEVISYFNSINGKFSSDDVNYDVRIYAVSYVNGGIFVLTSKGRYVNVDNEGNFYINDVLGEKYYIPENIQQIINKSIRET